MIHRLTIHGSGGHGHVVAACARALGYEADVTDLSLHTAPAKTEPCIIAIGSNRVRAQFAGYTLVTLIHPRAFVDDESFVDDGVFVNAGACVNTGANIGRGAIINTGAIVDHDCYVGAWSHISPGAVLCGGAVVGEGAWIGANAVIKEGIAVAPWSVVGCGGVVVKDITEPGTFVGNPAHLLKQ